MAKFIDVCSEQEADELIQELGLTETKVVMTSYGYRITYKKMLNKPKVNSQTSGGKNYVVTCLHPYTNGRMYIGSQGVTFNAGDAILFSKHDAEMKARYARINSGLGYEWESMRIK